MRLGSFPLNLGRGKVEKLHDEVSESEDREQAGQPVDHQGKAADGDDESQAEQDVEKADRRLMLPSGAREKVVVADQDGEAGAEKAESGCEHENAAYAESSSGVIHDGVSHLRL